MEKHETVREMTKGQFKDIVSTLIGAIPDDLTFQEAQAVTGGKGKLTEGVRKVFKQFRIGQPNIERYAVTVNYAGNKTIRNLLKEVRCGWVNESITDKNFPTDKIGTEEEEIFLVHFNKWFDNGGQVIAELDKLGYKPANPAQLLALGVRHPDLQRQFPIAALGQYWFASGGYRVVVGLDGSGERRARLFLLEGGWYDSWRFAVVRK